MRYFLPKSKASEQKLRKQFLFDVFHLWFVNNGSIGGFDILESFPFCSNSNILIIYGHNYPVYKFLNDFSDSVHEDKLFIISCSIKDNSQYAQNGKKVYLSPQTNHRVFLMHGEEFGFEFDITDVELNLYNSKEKNVLSKLVSVFDFVTINRKD